MEDSLHKTHAADVALPASSGLFGGLWPGTSAGFSMQFLRQPAAKKRIIIFFIIFCIICIIVGALIASGYIIVDSSSSSSSSYCAPRCPRTWIGDGTCDIECRYEAQCYYDRDDCDSAPATTAPAAAATPAPLPEG